MENVLFKEFVWAKLIGYPYWPAILIRPGLFTPPIPKNLFNERVQLVYFCGTYEYAWIHEDHIKPYTNKKYENYKVRAKKNKRLKKGIDEMDAIILKKTENPDYDVPLESWFNRKTKRIEMVRPRKRKPNVKIETFLMNMKPVFGVVGIGAMGRLIVENLLKTGYTVNAWNRTYDKYKSVYSNVLRSTELPENHEFNYCPTARYVLYKSNIVFFCISDVTGLLNVLNDQCKLSEPSDNMIRDKGIILITATDRKTSKEISERVLKKSGRFLEVVIHMVTTEEGQEERRLIASGDKLLYDKCQATCFSLLGASQYCEDMSTFQTEPVCIAENGNRR